MKAETKPTCSNDQTSGEDSESLTLAQAARQAEALGIFRASKRRQITLGIPAMGIREILDRASAVWNFSLTELWSFAPNESDQLTLHPDAFTMESDAVARCRDFRAGSEQYSFDYGQGMPGRVWSTGKIELQSNVQDLPPDVFLRHKIAKNANLCGAVAVPIIGKQDEIIAVLCAFIDSPLYSTRGLEIMLSDVAKVQFVANQIGKSVMSDPQMLQAGIRMLQLQRQMEASNGESEPQLMIDEFINAKRARTNRHDFQSSTMLAESALEIPSFCEVVDNADDSDKSPQQNYSNSADSGS